MTQQHAFGVTLAVANDMLGGEGHTPLGLSRDAYHGLMVGHSGTRAGAHGVEG